MDEKNQLQLRTLIKASGELEVSLQSVPIPKPSASQVLIRIEAAPVNPSDQGLLFGPADLKSAKLVGATLTARVPEAAMRGLAGRVDKSLPAGNEGAGVVVAAGSSSEAQALLGKTVAALGGGMYAQYRCLEASACLPLPDGTTPAEAASAFVNPLTALGMVETMRREGHTALVHTASASALGQMLNRICLEDGIGLVHIVRKAEQEKLLRDLGAKHVCDQGAPTFTQDLTEAIAATGATLAFDATGGGKLADQILTAMETVLVRSMKEYSRYGSNTHKQVYLYGGLDTQPTELRRSYGMAWGIGGWLVFPFLQKIGADSTARLKARVASGIKTTFATSYSKELNLTQMLQPEEIASYGLRSTGGKVLIRPNQ